MFANQQFITRPGPLHLNRIVCRSDKSRLPLTPGFWEDQFGQLRWNRKGWAATRCIFHASKSGKSFSVHRDGGFFCFGCGVSGGGLIDFVMLRDTCDFPTACKTLGCWDEVGQPSPPPVMVPVKSLVLDFTIDGNRHSVSVPDEPKNYAGTIRKFLRDASEELTAMGLDQAESGEAETYWTRLVLGHAELRELGVGL